ncbi:MAG: hypothetical protein R6U28_07890 [Cyclonatronaceae bacterium]
MHYRRYSHLLLIFAVIACSNEEKQEDSVFDYHHVHESAVFISSETTEFAGSPVRINATEGALFFSDHAYNRVTKVGRDGEKLFSFGSTGVGPGEFQSLAGFWVFDDYYLLYDYNGFKFIAYDRKGNAIGDIMVDSDLAYPDGFPLRIPITVEAINSHQLLIPSGGKDGSLFVIADIEADTMQFFGRAIGEHVGSYDFAKVQQAFSAGEIPEVFVNSVFLGSSGSGIYSFQQTTAILEKFDDQGEMIWSKKLKIPAQEGMFDSIARENRERVKLNEVPQLFYYARSLDVHDEGVAILLKTPSDHPLTVAWGSSDGSQFEVVEYHGIENEEIGNFGSFSVSPADSRAYFLNAQDGKIYEAVWPF